MAAAAYGSLPFKEQIAFFRRKLNLSTDGWTDIWTHEHDWSFVVAGANRDAIVADFRAAVDKVIADGITLEDFRKDFDAIVARHGWDYNGGRNWRSRVIYETNLNTSYAAGRHEQLQAAPYWRYVHSDWVKDPRPLHEAWDGLILARDDPWWEQHFPPNGWGCQCRVQGLWDMDLEDLGKSGPDTAPETVWEERTVGVRSAHPRTVRVPEGVDPGFEYTPGSSRQRDAARAAMDRGPGSAGGAVPQAMPVASAPRVQAAELDRRQKALGFPTGKGWELEPHELEFYELFIALGWQPKLIKKSPEFLPTNDFLWVEKGQEIEVKKPKHARYANSADLIRKAVERARRHDFVKDCFIIDLGDKTLTDKLRWQLEHYNVRNPSRKVRALWVMSRGALIEIELTDQK